MNEFWSTVHALYLLYCVSSKQCWKRLREGADKWLKVAVKVGFEIVDSYLLKTNRDVRATNSASHIDDCNRVCTRNLSGFQMTVLILKNCGKKKEMKMPPPKRKA